MKGFLFPAILICLVALTGCSKPSPEGLEIKAQAGEVVKEFYKYKEAGDDYNDFVAVKDRWQDTESFANAEADKLRKKFAQYVDMRIGVINGSPAVAANKVESEMESLISELEKKHHFKFEK